MLCINFELWKLKSNTENQGFVPNMFRWVEFAACSISLPVGRVVKTVEATKRSDVMLRF